MECVQGALVGGFEPETVFKSAAFMEDFLGSNAVPNAVSGDDLFVDELLDFSNDFSEEEEIEEDDKPLQLEQPEELEQDKNKFCSVSQEMQTAPEKSGLSANDDFDSLPETELPLPVEGLESLEWLSHFVEDSFSDYSLTGKLPPNPASKRPEPVTAAQEQPCFTTPVQTKARTKRARTGVRVWPVLSPSFTESSTSSSSSSSTTSLSPQYAWTVQSQTGESFLGYPPPVKKQKKKKADAGAAVGGVPAQPRRCSHCGVTKTPQWRAGPLGSKTLCNACGVRFKSGRLLPEYRPACSPTFSTEMHSNNHRKVLEMRRKKESETEAPAGVGPPVQSF
ncbi:hypothetical protein ABFS83_12G001800 [Erythranthe nasuta]